MVNSRISGWVAVRRFTASADRRFWLAATGGSVVSLLVLGIPTAVIPNPWFTRMLPTDALNVAVLILSVPLMGLLIATYVAPKTAVPDAHGTRTMPASIGGVGAYLAIGCPICNKIIVAALGISGAANTFAPLQPLIGTASLALLAATLVWRLRQRVAGCDACARIGAAGSRPP